MKGKILGFTLALLLLLAPMMGVLSVSATPWWDPFDYQGQIHGLKHRVEVLEQTVIDLQNQIEALETCPEHDHPELQAQINWLKGQVFQIKGSLGLLYTLVGNLYYQVYHIYGQIEELQDDVEANADAIADLHLQLDDLLSTLGDLTEQVTTLEGQVSYLQMQMASLQHEVGELRMWLGYQQGAIDDLLVNVTTLRELIANLTTLTELRDTELQETLNQTLVDLDSLWTALNALKADNDADHSAILASIQAVVASVTKVVSDYTTADTGLQAQIDALKTKLNEEVAKLTLKDEVATAKAVGLQDTINFLQLVINVLVAIVALLGALTAGGFYYFKKKMA